MRASKIGKCFIIGADTAVPISAVRAIWDFSNNRYANGTVNIVPAIKILRAVYPEVSLRDAKDIIDMYLMVTGTDIPEFI
jgi:hypothetical protein